MSIDTNAMRILIVDDDPEFIERATFAIEPLGMSRVALSGGAALTTARRWEPDIILLDMLLDDLDGFTFLERLSASGMARHPFILCTTDGRGADTRVRPLRQWRVGTLVRSAPVYQIRSAVRQAVNCQGSERQRGIMA